MRAFAMTGIVTASWISRILSGSAIRATPPSRRMSAGTRSSAITAQAPASSAMRACSAVVTSMITPPLSISARPLLTRMVPTCMRSLLAAAAEKSSARARLPPAYLGRIAHASGSILAALLEAAEDALELGGGRRDLPDEHDVVLRLEDVADVLAPLLRHEAVIRACDGGRSRGVLREVDRHVVARLGGAQRPFRRRRLDHSELLGVRVDRVAELRQARRRRFHRVVRVDGVPTPGGAGGQDRDDEERAASHRADCIAA